MSDTAATETLAQFAAIAAVPQYVRQVTRRYLLDWLGSAVAGGELEPPSLVRQVVTSLGGAPQPTVLATGERTSAPLAALANAAASHVLEIDDLDRASVSHPAAPIVAAALAVGEREDASGEDLLDAIAIGYEVGIRIGESLGLTHYDYWHTTGTAGTLGAAAAAARLSHLDARATQRALGSAGTGLWEFLYDGAMSKQLHPAKAAHDGVLASLLAESGFTSASRILEGKKGLLAAMSNDARPERLTEGLPDPETWRIEQVSFKVHAACRHTHSAVDAALELREQLSDQIDAIEAVSVRIYSQALGLLDGMEPTSPYAAKFSLPFCVAAAPRFGELSPARFTPESIADAETLALADRIEMTTDESLDRLYPTAWPSIVRVRLFDGSEHEVRVDHPAGDPESGISEQDLAEKFVRLTPPTAGDASVVAEQLLHREPSLSPAEVASALEPVAR